MPLLQDKVALVTGAGAGIGRAIALGMAAEGASVAAADIDPVAAQKTLEAMAGKTNRALAIEADCGDVASIDRMVSRVVAELGRIDIIVNNAGVTRFSYIMDLTEADWDRIHRVNAKGVFFCMQRAAKQMIDQGTGGRIINMASISGRGYSGASNVAYAASKGAVIGMTMLAAHQLGPHNINVNAICPGVTRTELGQRNSVTRAAARGITVEQMQAEQEAGIPIRRANTPDDIAAMAVFLASPGARNITGQAYNVDGGLVNSYEGSTMPDNSKILDFAVDTWKFEIGLFWQRSLFFGGLSLRHSLRLLSFQKNIKIKIFPSMLRVLGLSVAWRGR